MMPRARAATAWASPARAISRFDAPSASIGTISSTLTISASPYRVSRAWGALTWSHDWNRPVTASTTTQTMASAENRGTSTATSGVLRVTVHLCSGQPEQQHERHQPADPGGSRYLVERVQQDRQPGARGNRGGVTAQADCHQQRQAERQPDPGLQRTAHAPEHERQHQAAGQPELPRAGRAGFRAIVPTGSPSACQIGRSAALAAWETMP